MVPPFVGMVLPYGIDVLPCLDTLKAVWKLSSCFMTALLAQDPMQRQCWISFKMSGVFILLTIALFSLIHAAGVIFKPAVGPASERRKRQSLKNEPPLSLCRKALNPLHDFSLVATIENIPKRVKSQVVIIINNYG